MKNPLSLNFEALGQYDFSKLIIDEAVFFEWLILKRWAFKNESFYYQQKRVISEIGVRRRRLTTIKNKFIDLYGLESKTQGQQNITYFTVKDSFIKNFIKENIQPDLQADLLIRLKKFEGN